MLSASISTEKLNNKKIKFDDDGEIVSAADHLKSNKSKSKKNKPEKRTNTGKKKSTKLEENVKYEDDDKHNQKHNNQEQDESDMGKKWFECHSEFNTSGELVEMKDTEERELQQMCKNAFDNDLPKFLKKNPSDARWLETAVHSGTSKDRANAGALLITTNPLGNLSTLETLISFTKLSNKTSPEACTIVTELFMDRLLPTNRKLIQFSMRGADWKSLRKNESLDKDIKNKVLAYWYFENQLKEQYFEFLKNLQNSIQTGQDNNKNSAIVSAAKLLSFAPEKEQMLLGMLINKLGDPSNKVAAKSLHHLSEVAYKHPNMAGVMTIEAEKLLFRNNISEHAQHFALCFLAQIAPRGNPDVCTKLVNICFSLFNVLVKRGAVNSKTMQAILRCLQKAILEAKPPADSTEIMTKEMQDTIYRLVHLADIQIAIQTLSLLLQLITIKTEKADRFYNALYRKLLDLQLTTVGNKTAAQFLHIVHRAIHIDENLTRAKAFIKRLLQMSLYMPSQFVCGCLVVVSKLLKSRRDLRESEEEEDEEGQKQEGVVMATEEDLKKFDSDGEEKYEDVELDDSTKTNSKKSTHEFQGSSWHHLKIASKSELDANQDEEIVKKVSNINATKYDPYHRVPAYAGAEYSLKTELFLLKDHYHPTVKVFAENIIEHKNIEYYGDPLKDFGLSHFLERFAFKNPKKLTEKDVDIERSVTQQLHHKKYLSYGARGRSVKALTNTNCTVEERFIFNYLEKQREVQVIKKDKKEDEDYRDVDDDEFEAYIDGLCKKSKKDTIDDSFDMDYMKELGADLLQDDDNNKKTKKKSKEKSKKEDSDDEADIDNDWGDDDEGDEGSGEEMPFEDGEFGDSDEGSISLDEDDDDDDEDDGSNDDEDDDSELSGDDDDDMSEDDDDEPKLKKPKSMNTKSFNKVLNKKSNMNSLFAAADDFADLLEETGKMKGHGTSNAVFNKDKSSDKQLKWEEKRRSGGGGNFQKQHRNKFTTKKNKFNKNNNRKF